MGWCTGSEIGENLWESIKDSIPKEKQQKVAKIIYDELTFHDADCWENHEDSLWAIAYPEEFKKESEEEDD